VILAVAVIGGKPWCKLKLGVRRSGGRVSWGHTLSAKFRTPCLFVASITEEVGGESRTVFSFQFLVFSKRSAPAENRLKTEN
jgi:hypothetical protein